MSLFSSTFLSHTNFFFLFKPRTDDYITTQFKLYQFSLVQSLSRV